MSTAYARLNRLQHIYRRPEGCALCAQWGPAIYVITGAPSRPEQCPTCWRTVPIRLTREIVLVRDAEGDAA